MNNELYRDNEIKKRQKKDLTTFINKKYNVQEKEKKEIETLKVNINEQRVLLLDRENIIEEQTRVSKTLKFENDNRNYKFHNFSSMIN